MVSGWIGETLSILVSPFNLIGDAIQELAEKIGFPLDKILNRLNPFHDDFILAPVMSFLSNIVSYLNPLSEDFILSGLLDLVKDLISYINPLDDNFFLKIALMPEDGFLSDYANKYKQLFNDRFAFITQTRESFKLFTQQLTNDNKFEGVKIDLSNYGAGEMNIVSPVAINTYGQKFKFWIGGLMYFLTAAWLIRKSSNLIGAGR